MNKLSEIGRIGAEIQNFLLNNKLIENYYKELSMICGFLAGDGSLDNRYPHYEIRFYPDDKQVAIIFCV